MAGSDCLPAIGELGLLETCSVFAIYRLRITPDCPCPAGLHLDRGLQLVGSALDKTSREK